MTEEFSNDCHGEHDGKFCSAGVNRKVGVGYTAGVERTTTRRETCGKAAGASGLCTKHEAELKMMEEANAATRARGGLTAFQHGLLTRIHAASKSGKTYGATQKDAHGLLARGLVERVSGLGLGQGNTPQWKITAKGKERFPEPKIDGNPLPKAIRLGGTGKERPVVGETETHYLMGGYRIAKAALKPEHIIH